METQDDSRRRGEHGRAPFRSGRFFSASGKWFFSTREGRDHGPYESKQQAEEELRMFLRGLGGAIDLGAGIDHHASTLDPWGLERRR